jgi:DNA-binding winged helix-turn-helix (wHTH) protein
VNQHIAQIYSFGPYHLDAIKRLLLREGEAVPLKPKVFETLLALVEHRGEVMRKDELMRRVWPDTTVEEGNLSVNIFALRRALGEKPEEHHYIVTVPGRGYSFVAELSIVTNDGDHAAVLHRTSPTDPVAWQERLEPVGGAMPLDSPFYLERSTDYEFKAAVARRDSIVLVKGARQVGKTSLLARSLQGAREAGARVVFTDFQQLNASHLASTETLLRMLAKSLAHELARSPDDAWDAELGASMNFTRYVRNEVLGPDPAPLVWGLDEVDRLFTCSFGGEIFGLFRSWHNARARSGGAVAPLHAGDGICD